MIFFFIRYIYRIFREAILSIKNNRGINLITIGTFAISMTIMGGFLIVYINFKAVVNKWSEKVQLVIYLKDNLSIKDLEEIKKEISSDSGVDKYTYISKDEALKDFRGRLKENSSILNGLDTNPLPASFIITLKDDLRGSDYIKRLTKRIEGLKGIEDTEFGEGWIERFEIVTLFLRFVIIAIGGLLTIGLIFVVSNTIRLSLYSRQNEIEIMKLVGATNWFIRGPFMIEGLIQGLCGALLSLIILYIIYRLILFRFEYSVAILTGFAPIYFIPVDMIIYMITIGIIIGCTGSMISVGKFLKWSSISRSY
ncbi:MAG: ABC transporter permease [Nitrospinae bacterium]|nr:ABC transporter permease [Nitrospinota bacterium]